MRMFQIQHLDDFNPKKPTVGLVKLFKETQLPKSSYLNSNTRGKFVNELTLDQAEYISYELENGADKMKMLVKLYYFCRLYKNLEEEGMSEIMFDKFVDEEFQKENAEEEDIHF